MDSPQVSFIGTWQTWLMNVICPLSLGRAVAGAGTSNLLEFVLESKHICHPLSFMQEGGAALHLPVAKETT